MNQAKNPEQRDDARLLAGRVAVPISELRFTFSRSSGPGGQNVNKVNSKAQLRWPVTTTDCLPPDVKERFLALNRRRITVDGDFVLTSQRSRDQRRNVEDCLEKLRELLLAAAARPRPRKKTRPGRSAIERRLKISAPTLGEG